MTRAIRVLRVAFLVSVVDIAGGLFPSVSHLT